MKNSENATMLLTLDTLNIQQQSLARTDAAEFGLAQVDGEPRLVILAASGSALFGKFEGTTSAVKDQTLLVGPVNAHNIASLRVFLPWLQARPLGLRTSAGFRDRLGIATPCHIRPLRAVDGDIAPIFTQQSIREMTRTGRSAQQVMDDAAWGVFGEGWQEGFGPDADDLKHTADI